MKGIIALRMCDMSKYGGLPLEYGTVPAPVWRNIHPRLRMGTAARARAGVGEPCRLVNGVRRRSTVLLVDFAILPQNTDGRVRFRVL